MLGCEHNVDTKESLFPKEDPITLKSRQERIDVYYNSSEVGKYTPRTILVDLDPKFIIGGPLSNIVPKSNIHYRQGGSNNNWATGHYIEGPEMIDAIIDCVRREVERCDSFQGFQMPHSMSGGTGSGCGTLILWKLRDEYPDRCMLSFSVLPYSNAGDSVVAPYNAILALHQLVENTDLTVLIDNEALLKHSYGLGKCSYNNIDSLVASVMSGLTSCFRFSSPLNLNLHKLGIKMVPFPRSHFFTSAIAPNVYEPQTTPNQITVADLTQQMFVPKYSLTSCDPSMGKYLSTTTLYQGLISIKEIEEQLRVLTPTVKFARGCSLNVTTALCNVPQRDHPVCATYINNSTSIRSNIARLCDEFQKLFRRKAFLHSYLAEGMDEMEFQGALSNALDLVCEYKMYE